MKAAVVKETAPGERRVALVPDAIAKLKPAGVEVLVQTGAGDGARGAWAHATPATITVPALRLAPSRGVSIRDSVLIGACCDQPRGTQYASKSANRDSSISVIHLQALT